MFNFLTTVVSQLLKSRPTSKNLLNVYTYMYFIIAYNVLSQWSIPFQVLLIAFPKLKVVYYQKGLSH